MTARTVLACAALAVAFVLPTDPVTIHLAGDSTMAPKLEERRPETGWGEALAQLVDPAQYRVVNRAVNGRSTRTFIEEGRWAALVDALEPGDWVFIQFGHNDASVDKVDRYTPPADYRRNLERFVADVRARDATPVLMTPVARRRFDDRGRVQDSHGEYPALVQAVADVNQVAFIDMQARTRTLLQDAGVEASRALFLQLERGEHPNYPDGVEDNTHFSPEGARAVARLALEAFLALPATQAKGASPGP